MSNLKILKKKMLITGANGLLGQKLVQQLLRDYDIHGIGRKKTSVVDFKGYDYRVCDITDRAEVVSLVKKIKPDFIVNAAAFTNVDGCEDEKEECWKINVSGVENLAIAARKIDAFLVHISSDYVFDGEAGNYSEESPPNPLGYYGRSKLASENAVISSGIQYAIVRTMVLYGTGKEVRPNFATWLVDKLDDGEEVRIVDDQFGHPTLVDDLGAVIRAIVESGETGIFHASGSEYISRYDFAVKLADIFGLRRDLIKKIESADLNQKAPRPFHSGFILDKVQKGLGVKLHDAESGLRELKRQLQQNQS